MNCIKYSKLKCIEGYYDTNGCISFLCNLCETHIEITNLINHILDHFSGTVFICYKCRISFSEIHIFMDHSCNSHTNSSKKNGGIINRLNDSESIENGNYYVDFIDKVEETESLESNIKLFSPSPITIQCTSVVPKSQSPTVESNVIAELTSLHEELLPIKATSVLEQVSSPQISKALKTDHLKKIKRMNEKGICEFCGVFIRYASMKGHHLQHQSDSLPKFECDICGRICIQRNYLLRHMRIHKEEKPFACKICGHRFRSKPATYQHEKIHREGTHICTFCGKKFVTRKALRAHHLVHTGDKPFKCDLCDVFFRSTSARIAHRRLHTGEKPYKCKLCDKSFTQTAGLKCHIKTHYKIVKTTSQLISTKL